jgi:hypothetical protein
MQSRAIHRGNCDTGRSVLRFIGRPLTRLRQSSRTHRLDFDTVRDFDTVDHVPGKGGSLDVAGTVVAGGMIFVTSGYPQYGGIPGNVLLAFAAE